MSDIELVSTDDLMDELASRFDTFVVCHDDPKEDSNMIVFAKTPDSEDDEYDLYIASRMLSDGICALVKDKQEVK